nr:uncharacterized protein LOC122269867 [Parasteatoda tepidariorum]
MESHKDWDKILPEVQRCIDWSPSKSTGKPTFGLLYGYTPVKPGYFLQDLLPISNDYVNPTKLQRDAQESIISAQEKMKRIYDKHRCDAFKYNIGDVVVVAQTALSDTKTQVKYKGPLTVIKTLPSDTYQLTDLQLD